MTLFLTSQSASTSSIQAAARSKDDYCIVLNLLTRQYKRADARRQDFCWTRLQNPRCGGTIL